MCACVYGARCRGTYLARDDKVGELDRLFEQGHRVSVGVVGVVVCCCLVVVWILFFQFALYMIHHKITTISNANLIVSLYIISCIISCIASSKSIHLFSVGFAEVFL